jgi:transposase
VKALEELQQENRRLAAELATSNARVLELLVEIETWKRRLFGQKAERVKNVEAQTSLLELLEQMGRLQQGDLAAGDIADEILSDLRDEAAEAAAKAKANGKATPSKKKGGTKGRRSLTEADLPVHRVVLNPVGYTGSDDDELVKVGEEVSRHIDYQPHSHIIVEIVRPKCVKKSEASTPASSTTGAEAAVTFAIAEAPDLPISKGLAGPGLLANVIVRKYGDHLPLHRQERIFRREGVPFARSTLCQWVQRSTALLSHITEAMWTESKTAPLLLTDGCNVLIREPERCRRGHFQVFIDPGRHINFRYLPKSDGDTIAGVLEGFGGMLQADAAATYHETLRRNTDIIEVGCWAHARRNFFEALNLDRDRALIGIGFIRRLYDADRDARDKSGALDANKRKALAEPVLASLKSWLTDERPKLNVPSTIERALGYLQRHWEALTRFLDDGRLRLDNNPSELELRHQVVGRKNWLFCATDGGASWNAIAVSLIASCRIADVEPWAYLRDVLTLLPAWNQRRTIELAPARWQETRKQPETRELLDRRRLLGRGAAHQADDAAPSSASPNGVE